MHRFQDEIYLIEGKVRFLHGKSYNLDVDFQERTCEVSQIVCFILVLLFERLTINEFQL